ncbi:B12-binding domain-containing radical SAM protein, partial [Patescibacteria group bacterium]|nr:B12-binding domain-containing radical SAM protein [Patescibacteria group bacterium]
ALLAGYLRNLGYSVVLYDAEVENWSFEETAEKIKEADPVLALIVVSGTNPSASTMNMTGTGKIVSLLRKLDPKIKTILAGLHPSALPERTTTEESVDFVCQGEGFYTLPKLLDALKSGADAYPIEGLWHRKDGKIISNPRPPLMKKLDELPAPAWDLLPMDKYRAHNWHCFHDIENRQPYAILYTSLGCPFRCSFCCINALFGKNTIRYRGLEQVTEEIDFLVNTYGVKNIKIIDEMFALGEKRVIALCDMIIERDYDLNMWAYARVDTVTERMLAKMKQAGINWVAYGFESGNKRVIEDVSKGYKMEQVEKVVQITQDLGMHICANYIFGLPEDDYDSMNETMKLMLDINAEWANIYCAMAYPGSKLYDLVVEKDWPLPESWEGYSQYAYETLPLPTKYLRAGQVLSFRDYAFEVYYKSPRYLSMIEKKFGPETLTHIREMATKKLKRKYATI